MTEKIKKKNTMSRGNNKGLGGDANINAQNLSVSLKSAAKVCVEQGDYMG